MLVAPLLRVLLLSATAAVAAAASATVTVSTGATITGAIQTNVAGHAVHVFRGIPYAEPPLGDRRWKPSTLKPLTQNLTATANGAACHGLNTATPVMAAGESEDCLFLNVYAPAGATKDSKLPVMVWVHGGAFVRGSSNRFDGANLIAAANEQLVVVTLNYRIGVFASFSNKQILAEGGGANFGLQDQETAFQWVQQYISAFGGDPSDITAFGQSSGAMSLGMQLLARDGDQKLFHKVILQSGAYTTSLNSATPAAQQQQTETIAKGVGCGDASDVLACLRSANATAIFTTGGLLNWNPTPDGVFIKELPIKRLLAGKVSRVPSIVGTNSDEGWTYTNVAADASQFDSYVRGKFKGLTEKEFAQVAALYPPSAFATPHHRAAEVHSDAIFVCPSEQLSSALIEDVATPSYRYRFNYTTTEFGFPLVVHGQDNPYVFNQVANLPKTDVVAVATVVRDFQQYWTTFARTGSPNRVASGPTQQTEGVHWPLFTHAAKHQLVIQSALTTETAGTNRVGHVERCAFWLQVEQRIANEVQFLA